jgi:hypothetical protein
VGRRRRRKYIRNQIIPVLLLKYGKVTRENETWGKVGPKVYLLFCLLAVVGIELKALHVLGKCSTASGTPQTRPEI